MTPELAKIGWNMEHGICSWEEVEADGVPGRRVKEESTYMLKSTLCCGQTPRFWRMALSSVRMSFPMM